MNRVRAVLAVVTITAAAVLSTTAPAAASTTTGHALLGKLSVRAESHNSSYDRDEFRLWLDRNGDCQDTRSEVLQDESSVAVTYSAGKCSAVKSGRWLSWYDDATWTHASDVDIDHVVPLGEAWGSGAWNWTDARRDRYANDLGYTWTLDAVTDNVNQSKGDRDPAGWLPGAHQCKYARHWVAIKYRWRLAVDSAEREALAGILTGACGDMALTTPARAT